MLIHRKRPGQEIPEHQVTDEKLYLQRRDFIKRGVWAGSLAALGGYLPGVVRSAVTGLASRIADAPQTIDAGEKLNTFEEITTYNNFYELGTGKEDPSRNADELQTDPWSVEVLGECNKPGIYTLEDILAPASLEERIYRLRCVEAWSMVIPWIGFPLASLLDRFEPNGNAKYVAFETLYDPDAPLSGQRSRILDWPYREGLRIDEAMHPLSFMVVGLYGKILPNQNGAPLRLIVPWKYGFKSIKSIVRIRFTEEQPETSWNLYAPQEYGFYSNVNPLVDHPRWSQATERRIGEFFRRETLMFNGYADQVESLYSGMDLRKFY